MCDRNEHYLRPNCTTRALRTAKLPRRRLRIILQQCHGKHGKAHCDLQGEPITLDVHLTNQNIIIFHTDDKEVDI